MLFRFGISGNITAVGTVTANHFTGTASWANNSLTASYISSSIAQIIINEPKTYTVANPMGTISYNNYQYINSYNRHTDRTSLYVLNNSNYNVKYIGTDVDDQDQGNFSIVKGVSGTRYMAWNTATYGNLLNLDAQSDLGNPTFPTPYLTNGKITYNFQTVGVEDAGSYVTHPNIYGLSSDYNSTYNLNNLRLIKVFYFKIKTQLEQLMIIKASLYN